MLDMHLVSTEVLCIYSDVARFDNSCTHQLPILLLTGGFDRSDAPPAHGPLIFDYHGNSAQQLITSASTPVFLMWILQGTYSQVQHMSRHDEIKCQSRSIEYLSTGHTTGSDVLVVREALGGLGMRKLN